MDVILFSKVVSSLKGKGLFVMPKSLKLDALTNSLAIAFAVAMATFFVCDVDAIGVSEENGSSIITRGNPFRLVLILSSNVIKF